MQPQDHTGLTVSSSKIWTWRDGELSSCPLAAVDADVPSVSAVGLPGERYDMVASPAEGPRASVSDKEGENNKIKMLHVWCRHESRRRLAGPSSTLLDLC